MPDFDNNLNPVLPNTDLLSIPRLDNPATSGNFAFRSSEDNVSSKKLDPLDAFFGNGPIASKAQPTVSSKELYDNKRYANFNPEVQDIEDQKAYGQSSWDKAANGLLKGITTTATTFTEGTLGLVYGLGAAIGNAKLSSFYNNDFSNYIQDLNNKMEDIAPNYYTNAETKADWYSPSNWFKANFFWDKIIKNLGFSVGAIGSGAVTGGLVEKIPEIFGLSKLGLINKVADGLEEGLKDVPQLQRATKAKDIITNMSKDVNLINKLSASDRFIISGLGAATEGGIEAQQGLNEYRNALIKKYKDANNDQEPTGEELKNINKVSEDLGNARFGLNMLLLTATNYIQLPKILGASYRAGKDEFVNTVRNNLETGLLESSLPTVGFPKLLNRAKNVAELFFSPSEGFEEGAQYAIEKGVQHYYDKKNYNKDQSLSEFIDSFSKAAGLGIKDVADKEGMESILIGALSGGLQQAGFVGTYKNDQGKTRVGFGKSGEIAERGFAGEGGEVAKNTANLVAAAKPFTLKGNDWLQSNIDSTKRAVAIQEEFDKGVRQGDVLDTKDAEFDYQHNYLFPRIKYGRFDLVKQDISHYRDIANTSEGFEQLKQKGIASSLDTPQSFLTRLQQFEDHAKTVNSLHESLNLRYGSLIDKETKQPLYSDDVMEKMIYAAAKVSDYDRRLPKLNESLLNNGIATTDVLDNIITNNTPSEVATKEAINQINNLNVISEVKDQLKSDLRDVIEVSLRRKSFLDQYDSMKKQPSIWKESEEQKLKAETPSTSDKPTIKIKTKDGEEDLEVGTEYYLGKVTENDKNGKEVYRFPKLTILGENEDGSIKVKGSTGIIKDISKQELADYKLGKVYDTDSNKKAKFFMDNANTIFEFNFGKGKKQKGRLQFSPKDGVLNFVYKNQWGKVKSIEVTGDQFAPKNGFAEPMIKAVGKLTAQQKKSVEDFAKEKDDRLEAKRRMRSKIISDTFDEVSDRLDKTKSLIKQKYSEFEKIVNDLTTLENKIKGGDITKNNNFKATTIRAIKAANRLSRMQEQVKNEITALESEQEELEFNQSYLADLAQNIDELPTDSNEFLEDLKEQIKDLESLHLETGIQINTLSKIIDNVQKALDKAIDYVKDIISTFERKYPKSPTAINGQEWVDFLSANPNFLKLNENYREDLATAEDIVSQVEDLDITPNERTISELRSELEQLQDKLKDAEKEIKAKELILSKFNKAADDYKKEQEEIKRQQQSEEYKKQIFKTFKDGNVKENQPLTKEYEPESKKHDEQVFAATIPLGKDSKDADTPHHKRVNYFGSILPTLSDRGLYKAMIVTKNLGENFEGVISTVQGSYVPKTEDDEPIVALMVKENEDGTYSYIDEKGNPIGKITEKVDADRAVYQVMPRPRKFYADGVTSRFRKETSDEDITSYINQYKELRKKWMNSTSMQNRIQDIHASFGTQKEKYKTDTPKPVTNLVNKEDLSKPGLVVLSTKADEVVSNGFQSVVAPLGSPVIVLDNAVKPLNNRKLTTQEKTTIKSILQYLAKTSAKEDISENDNARILFEYLRGIIYWGIPRNEAGRNSIWFANGYLHFGNNQSNVPFTEESMDSPILDTYLNEVYNNTNANYLSSTEPFYEVKAIDKDGKVTDQKRWNNYQEFLISGEDRKADEIPLTTTIEKPILEDGTQTREGIYFSLENISYNKPAEIEEEEAPFEEDKQQGNKVSVKNAVAQELKPGVNGAFNIASIMAEVAKAKAEEQPKTGNVEVGTDAEAKKADIERRRQEELNKPVGYGAKFTILQSLEADKKRVAEYKALVEQQIQEDGKVTPTTDNTYSALKITLQKLQERVDKINTKYDAELAALETSKAEEKSPVIDKAKQTALDKYNTAVALISNSKGSSPERKAELIVDAKKKLDERMVSAEAQNKPTGAAALLASKIKPIDRNSQTRLVTADRVTKENWDKLEKWINKNLPGIPVYRVKNMIEVGNNTQAWGIYADGAIYLYENAEIGTGYHEVFHGIMDHFSSPKEKEAILNEFNSRKDEFIPRGSSTAIPYSQADYKQAEEKLAEEFREYVLAKGNKSILGRIGQFFKDLYNFAKAAFSKKSEINSLFNSINSGKYRNYVTSLDSLSYANKGIMDVDYVSTNNFDNLQAREKINAVEEKDLLEHMTSQAFQHLFQNVKDLFNIKKTTSDEFYNNVYEKTIATLISQPLKQLNELLADKEISQEIYDREMAKLDNLAHKIIDNWVDLEERHKLYMKTMNIDFDENDEIISKNEDRTGRETGQDAMQVDHIRKATSAIKFLMATLREVTGEIDYGNTMATPIPSNSSINGDRLLSFGKAFVQTLNNLADSSSFNSFINKLKEQAVNNPNYVNLFERIGGSRKDGKIQWDKLDIADLGLLISFFKTFSKQSPIVLNHYIAEDGSAYLGSGNIASATNQLAETYEQAFIRAVKKSPLFKRVNTKESKGWATDVDKLKELDVKSETGAVKFLSKLGINIEFKKLSKNDKIKVREAISGIYNSLSKNKLAVSINGKIFDFQGRLSDIAETQVKLTKDGNDSTFHNIDGSLTQSFVEKNHISKFAEMLNEASNRDALNGTSFSYLNSDVFSRNSLLANDLFKSDGNRNGKMLKTGYINGTIDETKGRKATTTDRLTKSKRLLQQLNLQLSGWYHSLIPADSSTEWMINVGNFITLADMKRGEYQPIYDIFKGYLQDEIDLAKENRQHSIYVKPRSKELRFFKDILGDDLSKKAVNSKDFEDFYEKNKAQIEKKIDDFINTLSDNIQKELLNYHINKDERGRFNFPSLDTKNLNFDKKSFSQEELNALTKYVSANFAVANIEMHKAIFGDPYEYKDEVKRIKSFLSPAETTVSSSPEINFYLNKFYNEGLQPTDIGYTQFKEYVNTIALSDVNVSSNLYKEPFVEPDAQGFITEESNREFRIKSGRWNFDGPEEAQYQYNKAWERNQKAGKNEDYPSDSSYKYSSKELEQKDNEILAKGNPNVETYGYILKPIVRGNKHQSDINSVIIDKDSLAPLSYTALIQFNKDSNLLKLYNKMMNEKIDYAVFESGRKVGNEGNNSPYKDGKITKDGFKNQVKIPYSNFSIQVDTTPHGDNSQTLGSQLTKLATMNFMAAGIPIDTKLSLCEWNKLTEPEKEKESPLYKEIKHNEQVLKAMIDNGYDVLLKKLGVIDNGSGFDKDYKKIAETLKEEILRRDVNDNILKALDKFSTGDIALESTPVYQQFKNILYSIVDKNVASLKVNGGPKVQMASTFFENNRITKEVTSKGKEVYASTDLKFYEDEDGKRYIEVYISSAYIRRQLSRNSPLRELSDEELFEKIQKESPGLLEGIGFRIPTQNTNSSDAFIIKKFLPRQMGDTVVVPSELVKKSGSDFDIDKLNTYLKNLYVSGNRILEIPYFGTGEQAKKKINDWLVKNELSRPVRANEKALDELDEDNEDRDLDEIDRIYKKSLQNEYYSSLQSLISHPLNFKNLTSANDAQPLKDIADEISKAKNLASDSAPINSLLDMVYMNTLRNDFVTYKNVTGIAATSQTGHSLRQRSPIYIDVDRIKSIPEDMKEWLGDGMVNLPHNTREINGKQRTSLSETHTISGDLISDVNSMVLDGSVDIAKGTWLAKLIGNSKNAPIFLFLNSIGVDKNVAAYFLNQPIIDDYLNMIDKMGYNWLFIDDFVDELTTFKYGTKETASVIDVKALKGNIGKEDFTEKEKAQQVLILNDYLKYAKLTQHLFHVTQGTNYDTANLNDPYLLYKKAVQLEKARNTIISSPDDILKNSFIYNTKEALESARKAVGAFLPTESDRVRNIIESVIYPYTDLSDKDFIKVSKQVVQSFLDYVIQTDSKLNNRISDLMVDDRNIPSQVRQIIDSLPKDDEMRSNPVIQSLLTLESQKEGKTNNLKLKTKNAEIYQQNTLIKAFQELKENPDFKAIYPNILRVSLLQGLANSPISFTQFIPVEDLVNAMQPIISKLDSIPNIEAFANLHMFERNNWNNTDVVPFQKAFKKNDYQELKIFSKVKFLKKVREQGGNVIALDALSRITNSDIVTISYNKPEYSKTQIEDMRKAGDYSYISKGLYQKVYTPSGEELYSSYEFNGRIGRTLFFRQINAWGDSYRLQEYYNMPRESAVDNGYDKIKNELSDDIVVSLSNPYLGNRNNKETTKEMPTQVVDSGIDTSKVEEFKGFWTREQVAKQTDKVFLFGDNTNDRINTEYIPSSTQAVIRGLPNAIGIDTKKDRGTNTTSYFTNKDFPQFKQQVDEAIQQAKDSGKTIVISAEGIGTGKAMLKEKAPKLFEYLQQKLQQLKSKVVDNNKETTSPKGLPSIENKNKKNC